MKRMYRALFVFLAAILLTGAAPAHAASGAPEIIGGPSLFGFAAGLGFLGIGFAVQQTGTLTIEDLLSVETQSVLEFGVESISEAIQADLDAHNDIMLDMVSLLATPTTDQVDTYGGGGGGRMQEVDAEGRAPTQKTGGFSPVGYPLRKFQFNIGWTDNYARISTPADLARQTQNAEAQHRIQVAQQIKKALYGPANYTFTDYLVNELDIGVKRLLNGDGAVVPPGPNGESFSGSTHTHYDALGWEAATAAQKDAAVRSLVDDLIEHGHGAEPVVVIARGDESKMDEVADFEPYKPVQIVSGTQGDHAQGTLDTSNLYNRAIGVLKSSGAEVWVKPWGVAGYLLATDMGADADEKPLKFRQRPQSAAQGLQVKPLIEAYPLTAEVMEAEFGFGVHQRTNGVILYTGGDTYQAPTFN